MGEEVSLVGQNCGWVRQVAKVEVFDCSVDLSEELGLLLGKVVTMECSILKFPLLKGMIP